MWRYYNELCFKVLIVLQVDDSEIRPKHGDHKSQQLGIYGVERVPLSLYSGIPIALRTNGGHI